MIALAWPLVVLALGVLTLLSLKIQIAPKGNNKELEDINTALGHHLDAIQELKKRIEKLELPRMRSMG